MNELDEYEALRNLNPSTDKLGRDRDFKDNTSRYLKHLDERLTSLETLIKKCLEDQK